MGLHLLDEQVSFSKEGFEGIELDDLDAGSSKDVIFRNGIKSVLQGKMEYAKRDESF